MRQFSYPNSQFTNILGGASIGWKLNVYDTGTTNKASIYSNLAQTTPTANPVIADADGFLASFYWTGTVDVVLTDENDNLIDSANGIQDLVSTINAVVVAGNISLPYGAASGSGDTITATLPITSDFSDGGMFIVRANAANTGAANTPNLQVNSYASRRIKKIGGVALIANDIVSGMNMILVYNKAQNCYYLINHEATFLKRDGTAKMLGAIDMDSHKITNLTAGTVSADAVNYTQLTTYTGNSAVEFAVAGATTGNSAVNRTQFDARTSVATTTQAGIVEICTDAELLAGASDAVVATPLKLRLGFAASLATNGYISFPTWLGGLIIQWGYNSNIVDVEKSISFPITFPTACYNVQCTGDETNGAGAEIITTKSVTTSGFTWVGAIGSPLGVSPEAEKGYWLAIGK
jgi:hypothetical protein